MDDGITEVQDEIVVDLDKLTEEGARRLAEVVKKIVNDINYLAPWSTWRTPRIDT